MNVELSSRGEGKNSHVIVVNESAALGKQEDTPKDVNPRVSSYPNAVLILAVIV